MNEFQIICLALIIFICILSLGIGIRLWIGAQKEQNGSD